jgi:hypothetical protein
MYPSDKFIMQLDLSVLDEDTNTYSNAFDKTYTRKVFTFNDDPQEIVIKSHLISKNNTDKSNGDTIITPLGLISLNLYSVNQNGYIKANERLHQPQTI